MPFAGLGLHVVIAVLCAIHAIRNRQQMYWLFILFAFPGLGSLVYVLTVYLPGSRLQRQAGKAVKSAVTALDPTRELREAADAYAYAPTAQNQMRLAAAQLEAGQTEAAVASYEACLTGPFANDLELRWGAARAALTAGKPAQALSHLDFIATQSRDFRPQETQLLRARALAALGDQAGAQAQFEATLARFGGFEPTAEFAIWAAGQRNSALHAQLAQQLQGITARWDRGTREVHAEVLRRLSQAEKSMKADGAD